MEYINSVVLVLALLMAAFSDVRSKKVPNKLTFPAILLGFILNIMINGFNGIVISVLGFLLGLTIFFIPFAFGLMGGGDVKLMAAIGALMGWKFTLVSAAFSAVAGIVVVVGYLIYKGRLFTYFKPYFVGVGRVVLKYIDFPQESTIGQHFKKFSYDNEVRHRDDEKLYVPYALAIALGTLFLLWKFEAVTTFLT